MSLMTKLQAKMRAVLDKDLIEFAEGSEAFLTEVLLIQVLRNQNKNKPKKAKKKEKK